MKTLRQEIESAAELWNEFEICESVHNRLGIAEDTERAYRFFEGEQWYGLESGNEELPVYNFIASIIKYKTSMVAMNDMSINYSAPVSDSYMQRVCASLSKYAAQLWERNKMDTKCWEAVKSAMIAGDSYVYFYDEDGSCQLIDRTDIFFSDETNPDIYAQKYIFIREKKSVYDVRREAEKNGISKDIAITIQPDSDGNDGDKNKCTSILKLELKDGDLYFKRFTRTVLYQPEQVIKGLKCYPVAGFVCSRKHGSCRGRGEVTPMIPNQIEINRNLARRLINAKLTAYSRLVYDNERIVNPRALTEVGTAIEVDSGGVSSIKDAVSYLTPSPMSRDAKTLSDELLTVSKELAGAGDAVLGNVDPTQASGAAIIAVRDQASIPLNEHTAKFKQFVEDIARILYRMWVVYNPGGMELPDGERISARQLELLEPDVRIDVSSSSPFSKYAREQALEKLFTLGHITFEEYVWAVDDDSSVPKSKLEQILKLRGGKANADRQNQ